jgi:hypothetical protein
MPVRQRRRRYSVNELSLHRYVSLELGPTGDEPEPFDRLAAVFHEYRHRFDSASWCTRYFEMGLDDRVVDELVDADEPCPGLPGVREG